jgi:hypothetical protein
MVRRFLSSALTVVVTLAVMVGGLFAVGAWRRSEDTKWCQTAVIGGTVTGDPAPKPPELAAQERSACAQQRRHQRMLFGSFWRKGGTAMAECGFQLAHLQMLDQYPDAQRALAARYGIDDPDFDGVGTDAQGRFIKACLAQGRRDAG